MRLAASCSCLAQPGLLTRTLDGDGLQHSREAESGLGNALYNRTPSSAHARHADMPKAVYDLHTAWRRKI